MMSYRKGAISGAEMTGDPHEQRFLGNDVGETARLGSSAVSCLWESSHPSFHRRADSEVVGVASGA